jgi:hypothetical protein
METLNEYTLGNTFFGFSISYASARRRKEISQAAFDSADLANSEVDQVQLDIEVEWIERSIPTFMVVEDPSGEIPSGFLKVEFTGEPEAILIVKRKMRRFLTKVRAVRQKQEAGYVFSMRRKIKKELSRQERLALLAELIERMKVNPQTHE